jgi:putative ABC transport system ATP-binding protein
MQRSADPFPPLVPALPASGIPPPPMPGPLLSRENKLSALFQRIKFMRARGHLAGAQGAFVLSTQPAGNTQPMIVVDGLRKSIRNGARTVDILRGLDFSVPRGEFVAIMGASGSGKSTLLGLLAGLDTPSAGNVSLNGTAISYLPEDRLAQVRGKTVGFVFQSYQLIPTLTALENVLLPHELNASGDGLPRARQLLASVGLGDRMDHYPVQLSGGEQQRVALARAFVLHPPIVLADEPTGNLDTTNGAHVLQLLLELNRSEGTTLVLVTHDPMLADYATRRIVLRDGLIVSDERSAARPEPVLSAPAAVPVGG